MDIFGFEISIWRIIFISTLLCIAGWNFFLASKVEGFQSGGKKLFDPLIACPAIRSSINNHETLLEGYVARDAVMSIKGTKHAIELLNTSYIDHECATISTVNKE